MQRDEVSGGESIDHADAKRPVTAIRNRTWRFIVDDPGTKKSVR